MITTASGNSEGSARTVCLALGVRITSRKPISSKRLNYDNIARDIVRMRIRLRQLGRAKLICRSDWSDTIDFCNDEYPSVMESLNTIDYLF